jgi:hypothetical protein
MTFNVLIDAIDFSFALALLEISSAFKDQDVNDM